MCFRVNKAYSSGGITPLMWRKSSSGEVCAREHHISATCDTIGKPVEASQAVLPVASYTSSTATAMSPLMWISLKPVPADTGHVSSPEAADSHGNIAPW